MNPVLEDIEVTQIEDGVAVVCFTGEHDLLIRDALAGLLDSLVQENDVVVADFSEAIFVDSSTLHVLLQTNAAAKRRGSSFRLQIGPATLVKTAFEISGILREVAWAPTRETVLDGSRPEPRGNDSLDRSHAERN